MSYGIFILLKYGQKNNEHLLTIGYIALVRGPVTLSLDINIFPRDRSIYHANPA